MKELRGLITHTVHLFVWNSIYFTVSSQMFVCLFLKLIAVIMIWLFQLCILHVITDSLYVK